MNLNRAAALLLVLITGCANQSGARMGIFSASAPVLAVLDDDLLQGQAVGYLDRTGTIDIRSATNAKFRCVGSFRYTGANSGTAMLRCSDGSEGALSFNALDSLSGYGYGNTSRGPASFTFGLTPEQAARYMTLPNGKRLIKNAKEVSPPDA